MTFQLRRQSWALALAAAMMVFAPTGTAADCVTETQAYCNDWEHWVHKYRNDCSEAVTVNVCMRYYSVGWSLRSKYLYGSSTDSMDFGTCDDVIEWRWTEDGSIPWQCQ